MKQPQGDEYDEKSDKSPVLVHCQHNTTSDFYLLATPHPKVFEICHGTAQYDGNLFFQSKRCHRIEFVSCDPIIVLWVGNSPIKIRRGWIQSFRHRSEPSNRPRQEIGRQFGIVLQDDHDKPGMKIEMKGVVSDLFIFQQERFAQVTGAGALEDLSPLLHWPGVVGLGNPDPTGAIQPHAFYRRSGPSHRFINVFHIWWTGESCTFECADSLFQCFDGHRRCGGDDLILMCFLMPTGGERPRQLTTVCD